MKRSKISANVIRRLPRYLRKLDDLAYHGVERISSGELGRQTSLTPSQIRQDFSCFGEFGQQGYGYNLETLRSEISAILGAKRGYSAILVGVGNLGHALMENFGFAAYGFHLKAAFDVRPDLVGTEVAGVPVYHVDQLKAYLAKETVDIAVLAVPRRFAAQMAHTLSDNGIGAIWNFTNLELDLDSSKTLVENIHFSDSLLSLSYYLTEARDEAGEA
jgi:redox-sensing transcriptional repressor